jgi:hypothetical protein
VSLSEESTLLTFVQHNHNAVWLQDGCEVWSFSGQVMKASSGQHNGGAQCAIIQALNPPSGKPVRGDSHAASLAIECFLKASKKPILIEPGEDPIS